MIRRLFTLLSLVLLPVLGACSGRQARPERSVEPVGPRAVTRPVPGPVTRGAEAEGDMFVLDRAAHRVVFVCNPPGHDGSALKRELDKALNRFGAGDAFNVIFCGDARPHAATDGREPLPWNEANVRRVRQFVEDAPWDSTPDPIQAIELALKQSPDLVYLVTDGDFPDNEAVANTFRRLNGRTKGGRARVDTILVSPAANEDPVAGLLRVISAENGGVYRMVDTNSLR
jgi:hypothetical protein